MAHGAFKVLDNYKLISADSHIVEPPDMYTGGSSPGSATGRRGWSGANARPAGIRRLGPRRHAGRHPGRRDAGRAALRGPVADRFPRRLGGRPHGGYDAAGDDQREREDGVWGSCLQPSQGLFWYRIPDSAALDRDLPRLQRLDRRFLQALSRAPQGHRHAQRRRCRRGLPGARALQEAGLVGAFIPVSPLADKPYRHPIYDRLWWTAQDLGLPLLLHIGTPRDGVPGYEFTMNLAEITGAGRSTTDYWVRYSLSSMIFAGVFDRYPRLKVGSVEHETAWIPHWLQQMDFTYRERPVFTKGWKSKEGLLPSDYWRRNMFVEFMEDDLGVQMRDKIGVETMLWGSDFPHAESTWPKSRDFLGRIFEGVPEPDLRKITSENAARSCSASSWTRLPARPNGCWTASCR